MAPANHAWADTNFIAPHTSKQLNHAISWCCHLCHIYIHIPLHIHMLPPLQTPLQWQRSLCEHRVVKVGLGKAVSNLCHMNYCNDSSTVQIIRAARQGTSAVTLMQRSTRHEHHYSTINRSHTEDILHIAAGKVYTQSRWVGCGHGAREAGTHTSKPLWCRYEWLLLRSTRNFSLENAPNN